jgi:hypothetical protein
MHRFTLLFGRCASILIVLTLFPVMSRAATLPGVPSCLQKAGEERNYFWTGSARIMDDITHREDYVRWSGTVRAESRDSAREQAKESMSEYAATWGKILEVHVTVR